MTNANDERRAHEVLDGLFAGRVLSRENEQLLRSFLPELPKQKTLEEICGYVDVAWLEADDPESREWLHELHAQLQGLKDEPANTPALPAGMRLAEHEEYGRCVVSPGVTGDGFALILALNGTHGSGAMWKYTEPDALTFTEAPAKSTRPEILETEADYENAPEGTIVAKDDISTAWIKRFGAWKSTDGDRGVRCPNWKVGHRIILRWGWKK